MTVTPTSDFSPRSDFLRIMHQRGFVHQMSNAGGLGALAAKGQLTTYVGRAPASATTTPPPD
ncbi:MAG: hypothetical protein AAFR60_00155 [Pseudomonadota bacterium]